MTLEERYDCVIHDLYRNKSMIHIYYKDFVFYVSCQGEDKWLVDGWHKHKYIEGSGVLMNYKTEQEMFNILDKYLPFREQTTLF